MSKALTPLEALNELKYISLDNESSEWIYVKDIYKEEVSIIETELNERLCDYNVLKFDDDIKRKKLKALEIIAGISKQTTHFRLIQRNMGNDEFNYYLAIDNCEYRLKDKKEYDLLKEILLCK